jgi:hypothetical protein
MRAWTCYSLSRDESMHKSLEDPWKLSSYHYLIYLHNHVYIGFYFSNALRPQLPQVGRLCDPLFCYFFTLRFIFKCVFFYPFNFLRMSTESHQNWDDWLVLSPLFLNATLCSCHISQYWLVAFDEVFWLITSFFNFKV